MHRRRRVRAHRDYKPVPYTFAAVVAPAGKGDAGLTAVIGSCTQPCCSRHVSASTPVSTIAGDIEAAANFAEDNYESVVSNFSRP